MNLVLDTDSYKASHYRGYKPNITNLFSYFESRGGEYDKTVFFGLQYYLKKYLSKPIQYSDVEEAEKVFITHGLPFNKSGWTRIALDLHGNLPIKIRATNEGSVVPTSNILMSVESTDPETYWVVNWLETHLSRLWYPCTVATRSYCAKQLILKYLTETSDDPQNEVLFKLHDFGSRGVSSQESAGIGGLAHLINFRGTDTVAALMTAKDYYNCDMAGFSIPAAEHSTITSWGRDGEVDAYRGMLTQFAKPGALVAVVSDSYDIYNAVEKIWGETLRQQVIDSGATVVIRPDSGDPAPTVRRVVSILGDKFGTTTNAKGYKILKHVRVIQGDGVNLTSIGEILEGLKQDGFSASNVAFGMGGHLLQDLNRDTLKFAFKASAITVNGEDTPISKDPVGAPWKKSKAGRMTLILDENGKYMTVPGMGGWQSAMEVVYENGKVLKEYTLDEIRQRVDSHSA